MNTVVISPAMTTDFFFLSTRYQNTTKPIPFFLFLTLILIPPQVAYLHSAFSDHLLQLQSIFEWHPVAQLFKQLGDETQGKLLNVILLLSFGRRGRSGRS